MKVNHTIYKYTSFFLQLHWDVILTSAASVLLFYSKICNNIYGNIIQKAKTAKDNCDTVYVCPHFYWNLSNIWATVIEFHKDFSRKWSLKRIRYERALYLFVPYVCIIMHPTRYRMLRRIFIFNNLHSAIIKTQLPLTL